MITDKAELNKIKDKVSNNMDNNRVRRASTKTSMKSEKEPSQSKINTNKLNKVKNIENKLSESSSDNSQSK